MNLPTENNWSIPQRQARAGLLVIIFKALGTIIKAIWPLLLVMLFNAGKKESPVVTAIFIGLPVLILVRSIIEFYYFRFYIANDELIIRKGFITKKNVAIPLEKIQAVHIEQGVLHQLAQVAKVKIDTAGSNKTEGTIDALPLDKAEELKSFLLHEKAEQRLTEEGVAAPTPLEAPIIRLSFNDIFKLGISANHIQTFFVVLGFSISFLNQIQEIFGSAVIKRVKDSGSAISHSLAALSFVVASVLLISAIVSMVRIALRYYDFTLTETAQGFRVRTGLINTRQNLVPYNKIQFISWEANWLRRKIGLFNLDFHQVIADENESGRKQKVKIPVTQPEWIDKLLSHYHDRVEPTAHSVHGIHRSYAFRRTLMAGILPVAVLLLSGWLINWHHWMLWALLWVAYTFLSAFVFRKNFRLFVAPDAMQLRTGVWGRESRVVKWYKIQHIKLKQSMFQRRKGLASLSLYTAGGTISIPFVPLELAERLRDYALYEIERSPRAWM